VILNLATDPCGVALLGYSFAIVHNFNILMKIEAFRCSGSPAIDKPAA
jgi:hypothetical protein